MSSLEHFCFLVVQRQKANLKRKRLLYALNSKIEKTHGSKYHYHKRAHVCKKERKAYRDHADKMKEISIKHYSPMRRQVDASVKYDGGNMCVSITHKDRTYSYKQVKEIADGYLFDTIVLDKISIDDPYKELI